MAQFSVETAWSVELEVIKNGLNNKDADLYSNAQSWNKAKDQTEIRNKIHFSV